MAKHKTETIKKPSKSEERHWQAQDLVRRMITTGPEFDRQVRKAEKELIRIEKTLKRK